MPSKRDTIIAAALKRGRTNQEVLERIRKQFPNTTMTLPTVNYHRNQLRKLFPKIPSEREAQRKTK